MIQKAIIEMISSPTTYKVRIPELNGVRGFVHSTPTKYLQDATVCAPPNAIPNYVEGDIVYVAYERDEDPVIIGKLITDKPDNTFQNIKLNNLSINGEINIGNTSRNDLLNLSNTSGNLQEQISNISSLLDGYNIIEQLKAIEGYDESQSQTLVNDNGTIKWLTAT